MIEKVLTEIARQVPALAVLGYIVYVFVRYMASRDETLKVIGESCHDVQRESIEALREVSRSMGEVTSALSHLNGKRH